jgi:HSP20 family molecular chaperone IbpA
LSRFCPGISGTARSRLGPIPANLSDWRFEMSNLARVLDSCPKLNTPISSEESAYALLENRAGYSILLHVPETEKEDIVVDLFENRRQLVVYRRQETWREQTTNYWVFVVPENAKMSSATMRFREGVLEIQVPKKSRMRLV